MLPFLGCGQFHVAAFLFRDAIAELLKELDEVIARK
jgi:hypothetical protein